MERIGCSSLIKVINAIAKTIHEKKEYLTELDAAIGDADYGINMARGFMAVQNKLNHITSKDIGAMLKDVGMVLVSEVGGASGPLFGTAFIEAGRLAEGKIEVDQKDLFEMGKAALAGIKKRGRSERGEKTMIDVIEPALEAFKASDSILEGLKQAAEAARVGVEETVKMVAKKGRASYLGYRSIGHPDPGATLCALMINIAYQILKEEV